ncbi:hypothetical protein [Actinoplanes sp. NPDC049681]|uniref:hypothetical protein n=1 Tax=Actinoplanes sp. NPDC049681 TaxID=3363905 RepID=UPI0037BBEA0F
MTGDPLNVLELFAGIGGLYLGLQRARDGGRKATRDVPAAPATCSTAASPLIPPGTTGVCSSPGGAVGRVPADSRPTDHEQRLDTAWRKAREKGFTPAQQRSPLGRRP